MKKWIIALLLFFFAAPLVCRAELPGPRQDLLGTLSGQVVIDNDISFTQGGTISFFNTARGIPPMATSMHPIPEMAGEIDPDGRFNINLMPGSYYIGVQIRTAPRGPGAANMEKTSYFARDDKGNLREVTIEAKEMKDIGQVIGALPDTFPVPKNFVIIEGRLVKEDGTPFANGVVLVRTEIQSRPDFVSENTGNDGKFRLQLPADTPYYLLARGRPADRSVPESYRGAYGMTAAIGKGGASPIGKVRPATPDSGMPQDEMSKPEPGKDVPKPIAGKPGERITGIEIMMFKVSRQGKQNNKLKGPPGIREQKQQE